MAGGLNKAMVIGNVGRDPEFRSFQNGGKVCNLSIATSESWKDKHTGEKKEQTEWHRIAIFGPLADIAEKYVKKGTKLYVEGQIKTRKWQDQQGNDRYQTEIVLQGFNARMEILSDSRSSGGASRDNGDDYGGGRSSSSSGGGRVNGGSPAGGGFGGGAAFDTDLDDDVPFVSANPGLDGPRSLRRRVL